MVIKSFLSGTFVKLITGLDDTMVHLPIITSLTRTRKGRLSFSAGIFLAVSLAIVISILFASVIRLLPYYHYISAGLILLLAALVYVDPFTPKKESKLRRNVRKVRKISHKRILQLLGLGFVTALATVIDDTLAYSSLFLDRTEMFSTIIGILYATTMELFVIISFSTKLNKIKYKKQITIIGLLILSILIFFGIL